MGEGSIPWENVQQEVLMPWPSDSGTTGSPAKPLCEKYGALDLRHSSSPITWAGVRRRDRGGARFVHTESRPPGTALHQPHFWRRTRVDGFALDPLTQGTMKALTVHADASEARCSAPG